MRHHFVFSIKTKLLLLAMLPAILITIGLGLLFAYELGKIGRQQAQSLQQTLLAAKKTELKQYIDLALSVIQPVYENARPDDLQAQEQVKAILRRLSYGSDGYFFIYSADGPMIAHGANATLEGKNALAFRDADNVPFLQNLLDSVRTGDGYVTYRWDKPSKSKVVEKLSYGVALDQWRWILVTGFYIDDIEDAIQQSHELIAQTTARTLGFLLILSGIILIAVILAGWRVAGGVVLNIQEGLTASERLAQGDLATDIVVRRRDEIGQILIAMNSVNENLRRIVGEVQEATEAVSAAAVQVAQGSADLAQRTEKQAAALGETASSMEQLTSAVQSNADSAVQAEHLASSSRDQAEQGGVIIEQLANSISEINASSSQIASIIGVIDEIAFQTNLLALNAAVEAARAGEQGLGFAVVAGEVHKLAQRSADAARQIKSLINDSVNKVHRGSQLAHQSGQTLQEIVAAFKKVSDIVAEMAVAAREQVGGIEQVNQAILQIDQVTHQNAILVEQTAAASQAMQQQTQQLKELMGFFQIARA